MSDWFRRRRLEWIAEMLKIYGYINRDHLMRKLEISRPQASGDLAAFERENPDTMFYNAHSKRYESLEDPVCR